jgi:hypothetical protein
MIDVEAFGFSGTRYFLLASTLNEIDGPTAIGDSGPEKHRHFFNEQMAEYR